MTPIGRRSRTARILTLASQAINVIAFDGLQDETVSGRAYREGVLGGDPLWARRADCINRLFRDPTHCRQSHELDVAFARIILGL